MVDERVRVIVLGDSGVGKTALVQIIAQIKGTQPSWTIGCNVEPILYTDEFIELWDVGGSTVHEDCRSVFMRAPYHGLILVHDLTNSKSYSNMWKWALEYGRKGDKGPRRCSKDQEMSVVRAIDVPVLIVGTKQDQLWSRSRYSTDRTGIVADTNAQIISVNCTDEKQFDNTYQQQQLHCFFDKVLQSKKQPSTRPRNRVNTGSTSYLDLGLS